MSIEPSLIPEEETLHILNALATGVNPLTGQPLPDDSIYQHARILRALQGAIATFTSRKQKKTRREGLPPQAGKPWTATEDELLIQGFEDRLSFPKLAEKHQRTRGSILSRLAKLGKIEPDPHWAFVDARKQEEKIDKLKQQEKLIPERLLPPRPISNPIAKIPEEDIPF